MRLLSSIRNASLWLCLMSSAEAEPLLGEDLFQPTLMGPHRRQDANETYPITGIRNAGIRPRLEVRDMEQNHPHMWNIYLLGLVRFQATDQNDTLSYYQICAIHGRPFGPWDGVQSAPGINGPGFCTHTSPLILPWHRPYLALYEQLLFEHIIAAVNEFPAGHIRQRYAAAALAWRCPFWDWAARPSNGSVYPQSIQTPTIVVTLPNGTATIRNPLFAYDFHPLNAAGFLFNPYASWNETKRAPSGLTSDAVSQNHLIGPILDNSRVSFQNRLFNLFSNYNNFTQFSNEAWITDNVQNADSVEALHDAIHSITGNNGHMTFLEFSSYDPIFWWHHCMVDRIFALYQAIYPNTYVEPMAAVSQTYTIKIGQVTDADSPLDPFHNDTMGTKWTANTVRSTRQFGYVYPETVNGASPASVRREIIRLYGGSGSNGSVMKRDPLQAASQEAVQSAYSHVANGKYEHYLANIVSQKFAVNGSYAVYLFLGEFDEDPNSWPTSPNLAGTHGVFAALSRADEGHGGAPAKPVIKVAASIPLTEALIGKVQSGDLSGMDEGAVARYLANDLHWRVRMFDGTAVAPEDLADLSITVVSADVESAAAEDEFPQWSNFTALTHITQGKPGGC